jgi:hypothetical protein
MCGFLFVSHNPGLELKEANSIETAMKTNQKALREGIRLEILPATKKRMRKETT